MERILILDDDPANLQGIGGVLRSEGYFVIEASSGLQAIAAGATSGHISLFISDMDLPSSSGTEIALKMVALYRPLPVLFISGTPKICWTSRDLYNFKLFQSNRVDFIEKPFSVSKLLTRIRSLIAGVGWNQAA